MPRRDRFDASDALQICPRCNGSGQITNALNGTIMVCPTCNGSGRVSASIAARIVENDSPKTDS
jgi:DnaJ-class molecular chaperone